MVVGWCLPRCLSFESASQSPCNQPEGSCLSNQLYDYYTADLKRIAAGTTPIYMVARWGGGLPNAQQVTCIDGRQNKAVVRVQKMVTVKRPTQSQEDHVWYLQRNRIYS